MLRAVLLLALVVRASAEAPPACPRAPESCVCFPEASVARMSCPRTDGRVTISVRQRVIDIHCKPITAPEDLPVRMEMEARRYLRVQTCPLPALPIAVQFGLLNATVVRQLHFQSYRNLSEALTPGIFHGMSNVKELHLSNNGLTALPPDLFVNVPKVRTVNLRNNSLVELPDKLFQQSTDLESVELGKNELIGVPPGLFENTTKLTRLSLWNNKLHTLSDVCFSDLRSLRHLDLRNNRLHSLPKNIFNNLSSLEVLYLNQNEISFLPTGVFEPLKNLKYFHLSDNSGDNIEFPSGMLSNLHSLTEVEIKNNNLRNVPEDIFWGSKNLRSIDMGENKMSEIPEGILRDCSLLEKINFSGNEIKFLPDGVFINCDRLSVIDLSHNELVTLPTTAFRGVPSLRDLKIRNNFLKKISIYDSKPRLRRLDLANNDLGFEIDRLSSEPLLNELPLIGCHDLEVLDLSNNSITVLNSNWIRSTNIKEILLNDNAIRSITWKTSTGEGYDSVKVDIRNNNISSLPTKNFSTAALTSTTWLTKGNPLHCDCLIFDFVQSVQSLRGELSSPFERI